MIYVGALWGDWFDWELVNRLACAYPDAAVVIIGDYPRRMPAVPPNVLLLGLKAQIDLPAYLAHAAVAIVPWKVNEITDATSPLKVYEYLAMRRPVVAPQLASLVGIPGVWRSRDTDEFVLNVGRARGTVLDRAIVDAFVRDNTWSARIEVLVELLTRVNPRDVRSGVRM
jgi:glycosyltransferase involved in cell wall biosynthesis